MQIIERKISELKPYANNPRLNDGAVDAVAASIKNFGFKVPLVVTADGEIIAGHTRLKAAQKLKMKTVPVIIADDLTPEQVRAFRLADNKVGELAGWDFEKLDLELAEIDLDMSQFGFSPDDNESPAESMEEAKGNLAERFLIPPFSILDTAKAEWQERKREWRSIGLKSTETREKMKATGNLNIGTPYYKKNVIHNDDAKTSLALNENNWLISEFDPVLAEVLLYWFSFPGAKVLDPFCGGSVRGVVAAWLKQEYTGCDLRREQIDANIENGKLILNENHPFPNWICGDSCNITELAPGEYDFVFSCPPYVDLEVYSDDPKDLSNQPFPEFIDSYRKIISASVSMLKENRFACFVVSEVRDKKGLYYNFVAETIRAFIDAGCAYYNELILKNMCGSVPMRASNFFGRARKIGRIHQNILVFFKGDPRTIKDTYGEIQIASVSIDD